MGSLQGTLAEEYSIVTHDAYILSIEFSESSDQSIPVTLLELQEPGPVKNPRNEMPAIRFSPQITAEHIL
jgi:hypothetical protein